MFDPTALPAHRPAAPEVTAPEAPAPIAIIGIGCRLPGGVGNADSYWQLLAEGRNAVGEVSADRWSLSKFYHPRRGVPGKTYSKWAGLLAQIDQFDPEAFGISPREAPYIDPQQRLLLEVAREAFDDAGQKLDKLAGSRTGVYVGISTGDYGQLQMFDPTQVEPHSAAGSALSIAANRVSYCFNLKGPSIAVDTACSSSLVSVALACESLWRGETDLALAGGVNVIISVGPFIAFSAATMLSADGRCKTFDASADGFVRGEGAGLVLLKPLAAALADHDPIHAVILGAGVNQDGRTSGISLPSQAAQQRLLEEVYGRAGLAPDDVHYVEAHGTGTAIGDPIEAAAIGEVLGRGRQDGSRLLVGSVKSNIGHLESAAGIAGLIKAALVVSRRAVPPSLHFATPNPRIDFAGLRLDVVTSARPFEANGSPIVAGVNSFSFGGTNAHVIVASPPATTTAETDAYAGPWLFPLSASSNDRLRQSALAHADFLAAHGPTVDMRDLCHTAATRRSHYSQRLAVAADSPTELEALLRAIAAGERRQAVAQRVVLGSADAAAGPVFVFSGQGPQWWGMGRELLRTNTTFRDVVAGIDREIRRLGDWSLLEEMAKDEAESRMDDTAVAQPALFALQVGVAQVLAERGVRPSLIVGHSVGEVAAACVAGALDLVAATRVIFHRGRCMAAAPGGRMLALGIGVPAATELIAPFAGRVTLGAHNGPDLVTLSGDTECLEQIAGRFAEGSSFCRFLPLHYAFHSAAMDVIRDELMEALAGLAPADTTVRMISTVTGTAIDGRSLDGDYWWRNIRQTVRFADAIASAIGDGRRIFVEIGPHPVLAAAMAQIFAGQQERIEQVETLRRGAPEERQILLTLGQLFALGVPIDWSQFWPDGANTLRLPGFSWMRQRYWQESELARLLRSADVRHPLLGEAFVEQDRYWTVSLNAKQFAFLRDHRIRGKIVFPAAAYVEMALAASRELFGAAGILENVQFSKALVLPEDDWRIELRTCYRDAEGTFSILSRDTSVRDRSWSTHCSGYLRAGNASAHHTQPDDSTAVSGEAWTARQVYELFNHAGLNYGPDFRGLRGLQTGKRHARGEVTAPDELADQGDYLMHPALMDACFQAILGAVADQLDGERAYLPVRVGRVEMRAPADGTLNVDVAITRIDARDLVCRLVIRNALGETVATFDDFGLQAIAAGGAFGNARLLYDVKWEPALSDADPGSSSYAFIDSLQTAFPALCRQVREQFANREARARAASAALDVLAGMRTGKVAGFDRRFREFAEGFPEFFTELTLVQRGGNPLAPESDPDEIRAIAHFDQSALACRAGATLIAACVDKLVAGLPNARRLRVLEIGTRAGGLAAHVLPALSVRSTLSGEAVRCVLTDSSPPLVDQVRRTFHEYPFVESRVLDIRKPLAEQCFEPASFDLVIATDIPATADEAQSLDNIRWLLTDGGLLILRQYAPGCTWMDRTHEPTPAPGTLGTWAERLHIAGFVPAGHLPYDDHSPQWPHDIRLARKPIRAIERSERVTAAVRQANAVAQHWLIFDDGNGLTDVLACDLRAAGHRVSRVSEGPADMRHADGAFSLPSTDSAAMARMFAELSAQVAPVDGVVYLWPMRVDLPPAVAETGAVAGTAAGAAIDISADGGHVPDWEPAIAEALTCYGLVSLFQALEAQGHRALRRLLLCTRNAQPRGAGKGQLNFAQAPALGLGRVVAQEQRGTACRMIDLQEAGFMAEAQAILKEINCTDAETEVVWAEGTRYLPRLQHLPRAVALVDPTGPGMAASGTAASGSAVPGSTESDPGPTWPRHFRLVPSEAGTIDGLVFREQRITPLRPGEVEIRVRAVGLNFRDVLKALRAYPTDVGDALLLGDECAGEIVAVGPEVASCAPGDRVLAIAPGCLGPFARTHEKAVIPLPADLSCEQAVTLPIAFLTASYALHWLGRIEPGDTVLIHSAAGGVGLAALQVARRAGARVFATAGTPEKRELLRLLGAEQVMNSRSLAFADEVMALTDGRGVDIVLNSLAGAAIRKSVDCLAPSGRFLELGKRDIYQDSKLGLWGLRSNISFHAIDLGRIILDRPDYIRKALAQVVAQMERREYHALPLRSFPLHAARDAFRLLAQGQHVGKLVITLDGRPVPVERELQDRIKLRADACYLVTGGLGGFGFKVAEWLVARGARHLLLVGRNGVASAEAGEAIDALRARGVTVEVLQVDVADPVAVRAMLDAPTAGRPPLQGVIHAAGIIDDVALLKLDPERFRRVMAPKVDGCWNLHRATLAQPLDFFVLFSSVSAAIGNPGQANYAAANAFLDAFAQYRRALGRPALSISWGAISGAGYLARNADVAERLEKMGVAGISTTAALDIMERLLTRDLANVMVASVNWRRLPLPPKFAHVQGSGSDDGDDLQAEKAKVLALIREAPPGKRLEVAERYVVKIISGVLGIAPERFDVERPLSEMGLDSLMGLELLHKIQGDFDIRLSDAELVRNPTARQIARIVLREMAVEIGEADGANGASASGSDGVAGPETRHLKTIRDGDTAQAPLLCFHGADGEVTIYKPLAESLAGRMPVIGVVSPCLLGERDDPFGSDRNAGIPDAEALAELYVREIRARQPVGPYRLLGFSFGSLFAVKVAGLLEAQGEGVEFIGVIDADPSWPQSDDALYDMLFDAGMALHDHLCDVSGVQVDLDEDDYASLRKLIRDWITMNPEERVVSLSNWLMMVLSLTEPRFGNILIQDVVRVCDQHISMIPGVTLPVLGSTLHCWWSASESIKHGPERRSWKPYTTGDVIEETLDGTHWAVMSPPYVERIAEAIVAACGVNEDERPLLAATAPHS